ncbi:MAG: hypothetical protein ABJP34_13100 [Erythrobacter sp.]
MNIPQIELSALPGLDVATGVFGSLPQSTAPYSDTVVAIMVYVYDTLPPDALI